MFCRIFPLVCACETLISQFLSSHGPLSNFCQKILFTWTCILNCPFFGMPIKINILSSFYALFSRFLRCKIIFCISRISPKRCWADNIDSSVLLSLWNPKKINKTFKPFTVLNKFLHFLLLHALPLLNLLSYSHSCLLDNSFLVWGWPWNTVIYLNTCGRL